MPKRKGPTDGLPDASSRLAARGFSRGWMMLKRDRTWKTTFAVLFGIALFAQAAGLFAVGVWAAEEMLRAQTDVRLQLLKTADEQRIQDFFAAVRSQPTVTNATFVTKEQAYELERKTEPEMVDFLEKYGLKNPFFDTISVTLHSLDDYQPLIAFVTNPQWNDVVDPAFLSTVSKQNDQVRQLYEVSQSAKALAGGFLFFAFIILLFTVTELSRVRSETRHDEVMVERLVGAQPFHILMPFVAEAFFLLLGAFALAIAVMIVTLWFLPTLVPAFELGGVLFAYRTHVLDLLDRILVPLVIFEIVGVFALAFLGTWLGAREKVKTEQVLR